MSRSSEQGSQDRCGHPGRSRRTIAARRCTGSVAIACPVRSGVRPHHCAELAQGRRPGRGDPTGCSTRAPGRPSTPHRQLETK
jgi:hypothetical protein